MYKKLHKHVHRRILIQLLIIVVAAVFLLVTVVGDAYIGDVGVLPMAIAFAIGLGVGYLSGRMFALIWHEETQKIIIRMDKMSFVLIALYIVFRIFSTQLLGDYFTGVALSALSFALIDGILIGRLMSMWKNIGRILKHQGVLG